MDFVNSNIDINKYKVFLAVAECQSFSKAVEYLHISQPAISHAIKELEEQLGVKLFIRNNKTVLLTEEGERIRKYAKKAFDTLLLGEKSIKEDNQDLNGTVRLGICSHVGAFMLPKIIKLFSSKYPNAKLYIYSTSHEEMLKKMKNNELDIIVVQYPIFIADNNYKEEMLCELKTCFYSNKEFHDKYNENHNLITELPIMLPTRGFPDIDKLEITLKKHNIKLKQNYTVYTSEVTKELVKEGLGISWGIENCIKEELNKKELYKFDTDFKLPIAKFSMAYNENILNNTSKEFIKILKDNINDVI